MTFSNINVSNPNDGLGDKLRDAFVIVNDNFSEVESFLVSQVTDSYLSATLSNYVTLISFNNQNDSIGATISTLQSDINNRALLVHTHSVSNVTGLQGQLDSKATLTQLNNAISALNETIAELNVTISNKIRTYKVYSALLSQSGTNDPVAVVLENTLGQTITWSYNGIGNWNSNDITGATQNNLYIQFSHRIAGKIASAHEHNTGGASRVNIIQAEEDLITPIDSLENGYIEIRVYN